MKNYIKAAITAIICGVGSILLAASGLTWAAALTGTIAVLALSATITEWEARR